MLSSRLDVFEWGVVSLSKVEFLKISTDHLSLSNVNNTGRCTHHLPLAHLLRDNTFKTRTPLSIREPTRTASTKHQLPSHQFLISSIFATRICELLAQLRRCIDASVRVELGIPCTSLVPAKSWASSLRRRHHRLEPQISLRGIDLLDSCRSRQITTLHDDNCAHPAASADHKHGQPAGTAEK